MVGLAVERDRSCTVHRLEILLDLETRGTVLLDDRQRAIAMSAESLHRGWVEHGAIRASRKRKTRDDLAGVRVQDHHHGLCRIGGRVSRVGAGREKHMILRVQRKSVASALVAERIVTNDLHCFCVDRCDAARHILHDDIKHAFAVADSLFRHAA